jgi:hypothetical protein
VLPCRPAAGSQSLRRSLQRAQLRRTCGYAPPAAAPAPAPPPPHACGPSCRSHRSARLLTQSSCACRAAWDSLAAAAVGSAPSHSLAQCWRQQAGRHWRDAAAHQYGLMDFWPPMSQTFSLNPSCSKDLMLNPCHSRGVPAAWRVTFPDGSCSWHAGQRSDADLRRRDRGDVLVRELFEDGRLARVVEPQHQDSSLRAR